MPAPFEPGHHFLETDGSAESIGAAIEVITHPQRRRGSEVAAQEYYDQYLAPTSDIYRLLGEIDAPAG